MGNFGKKTVEVMAKREDQAISVHENPCQSGFKEHLEKATLSSEKADLN